MIKVEPIVQDNRVQIISINNEAKPKIVKRARKENDRLLMKYKKRILSAEDIEKELEKIIEKEGGKETIANRVKSVNS